MALEAYWVVLGIFLIGMRQMAQGLQKAAGDRAAQDLGTVHLSSCPSCCYWCFGNNLGAVKLHHNGDDRGVCQLWPT